jgi:hypothetical protein
MMATADEDKTASVEDLVSAQLLRLYWCCLFLSIGVRQATPELQEAWILAEIPTTETFILRNLRAPSVHGIKL